MRRNAVGHAQHYIDIARQPNTDLIPENPATPIWQPEPPNFSIDGNSTTKRSSTSSTISDPKSPRSHSITKPCTFHTLKTTRDLNGPQRQTPNQNQKLTTTSPPPQSTQTTSSSTTAPTSNVNTNTGANNPSSIATTNTEAATKLAEALDDFLGDVERKFKGISDEILARLDEMAERCDRLEGELLRKETGVTSSGTVAGEGGKV